MMITGKEKHANLQGNKTMKRIYLAFLHMAILAALLLPGKGAALDMDFDYDANGRLINVRIDSGRKTISYQYDADGNLVERKSKGSNTCIGGECRPFPWPMFLPAIVHQRQHH